MGRTVVIAEKPSVGRDIARVLGCQSSGRGCLTGGDWVVTWAVGHLVTLVEPDELDEKYKRWSFDTLPILPAEIPLKVIASSHDQFAVVRNLINAPETDRLICATDAGREGELIFRYIYEKAGCKKPFDRLWISSMTDEAIQEGFRAIRSGSDYDGLYRSAQCRSQADWLVGMNASRAFTLRYDALLSVGRVQTPTLSILVKRALESVKGQPFDVVAETIKKTAFKITRVGQLVAQEASQRLNIPFGIVDLPLAPTPPRGDSVAHVLTEMGLEMAGAPGTTAALALLNDAVKKGGVMASNHVGGLSGAFIPVSEDIGMIEAASAGALTLEKLEAMTCVCSVGLDMIAIPGDTSAAAISGIIADEAAIGMVNNKTTAVRVIPAVGKKAGDTVEFGGLLGFAPVMPVNPYGNEEFVARGGRIPAPLHSLRN